MHHKRSTLDTLDMSGTSIKNDNFHFLKLWCLSACKKWTPFVTSFFRYCKDIANLLLWVLWECLIMTIIMIVWTCRKLWYPNCWNQYVGNSDIYPHAEKKNQFSRFCKDMQTRYFGNFWNACPFPSKIIVSICRKLSCLSACKKSTSSLISFLQYCNKSINVKESIELQYQFEETYDFIGRQKINFKFFLRYSKDNLLKR